MSDPLRRRRGTYTEMVLGTVPTYYWSMEQPAYYSKEDCWAPDAGRSMFKIQSSGVSTFAGPYRGEAPPRLDPGTIAHSGVALGDPIACYETLDGTASGPSVNANRNTTGYSYMIWAKNLDTALSDRAYCGNWTTNAGSMLYVHTGSDLRVYHNGSVTALAGYKDAVWHHWCVTWDGTTQTVYRDGVSISAVARSGALGSAVKMSAGYYNFSLATDGDMALCHYAWWENVALPVGTIQRLALITP